MSNRETFLANLRGGTLGEIKADSSAAEVFQNQTLRPILKLQNELLLTLFQQYFAQQKNVFYTLSAENKKMYVKDIFLKDKKFLTFLKGVIIGLFSVEELGIYAENSSELNKRMMTMLQERIQSQLDFFA